MNLLAAVQAAHEFHQNVMRGPMDCDNLGCLKANDYVFTEYGKR